MKMDAVHIYAYLLQSSSSLADISVLLQGVVLIKKVGKSHISININ